MLMFCRGSSDCRCEAAIVDQRFPIGTARPVPTFKIGDRLVDPSLNRVTFAGRTVQVEPKIMQVLVALAERAGQVVTRDELMSHVWNGVFVTDDALHRAVRELRRLFEDDREQPRVIETIRKRGYRLIAPVGSPDVPAAPDRHERTSRIDRPPVRRGPAVVLALGGVASLVAALVVLTAVTRRSAVTTRSEEHTSELQS